jgi:ankyrin repeat protein
MEEESGIAMGRMPVLQEHPGASMDRTKEFFAAISAGDATVARTLLEAEPELAHAKNEQGQSAVLASIYNGLTEIRDLLISRGAELEVHEAAAAGQLDRVKHLVDANPGLARSYSPDGFPVFALTCAFGHLPVAMYLFEMGALVDAVATNGTGYNALTGAVAGGRADIVDWLLQNGAEPNYRYGAGFTPLLTAAANGHLEIVKMLLLHGADAGAKTNDGKSAVDIAEERKHPAVAQFLRSGAKA